MKREILSLFTVMCLGTAVPAAAQVSPVCKQISSLPAGADNQSVMIVDDEGVDVVNGKVTINDDIRSIVVTREVDDIDITYVRTVSTTSWQTWFVPFEFVIPEGMGDSFLFAKYAGAFAEEDGAKYISFVALKEGDKVLANTPFIFRRKSAGSSAEAAITVRGNLKPTRTDIVCRIESAEQTFEFKGIYADTQQTEADGSDRQWFTLNTKGQFVHPLQGTTINAMRVLMYVDGIEGNRYVAPKVENVGIKVMGVPEGWEDDFTCIAGPVSARNDAALYDVTGRKLASKDSLKKGRMYIMNNKKYIR